MRVNAINIASEYRDNFLQLVGLANRSIKLTGNADNKELVRVVDWLIRGHDVALIKDSVNGDYFSRVTYPHLDEYDLPDECYTVRKYGSSMHYVKGEFVPLYISPTFDNRLVTRRLYDYARLLTLIDSVLTTNIDVQRTPYVVTGDKNTLCRIEKLFNQLMTGEPLTVDQNNMAAGKLEVLDLNAPYIADKLYDIRNAVKYDMLTFIGINNSSIDKSQYVSDFENSTNNEATGLYQDCIIGVLNECLEGTGYKAETRFKNVERVEGDNNGLPPNTE